MNECGNRFSRRKLSLSPKPTKLAQVFSLECFPLYDTLFNIQSLLINVLCLDIFSYIQPLQCHNHILDLHQLTQFSWTMSSVTEMRVH